ncbi:M48 family peptidase [Marinilabiliaceae bacterium JC017]|nr:M48 family peptidase [Marinilabiliaceae bacterium JC017]
MSKDQVIDIPEIGKVTINISNRAKRIGIRLRPDKGITLVIPHEATLEAAIDFLHSKQEWIHRNMEKIEEKALKQTIFDEQTDFKIRSLSLKIEKQKRQNVHMQLHGDYLMVHYPDDIPVTDPQVQDAIRYGIEEVYRMEAKSILPVRLNWLAKQYGFTYKQVFIKNLKSKWGSCSGQNNINLNLHLMRLPDVLIDYVLLHELCHTVEKNHGFNFWSLLDKVTDGKARLLDAEMKEYHTTIY